MLLFFHTSQTYQRHFTHLADRIIILVLLDGMHTFKPDIGYLYFFLEFLEYYCSSSTHTFKFKKHKQAIIHSPTTADKLTCTFNTKYVET